MIKKISAVFVLLLFIVFSSFIKYKDISKYDIVSGIALDFDGKKWTVLCEVCLPSSTNDFGSSAEYVKGSDFTLENALYNAGLKSNNVLYIESAQLYIIGEKALQKSDELENFFMRKDSNLRAIVVTSHKNVEEILQQEKEGETRAKSLSLAEKLKSFCKENNYDMPHVMNFLKDGGSVRISNDGLIERRAGA